jgi:CubicO group peptidase (beta-lactamase class C family)
MRSRLLALTLCGWLAAPALAEPDEALLGQAQAYPVAPRTGVLMGMPYRVGTWSAPPDGVAPGYRIRRVPAAAQVSHLPRAQSAPPIQYRFRDKMHSLDDYLERQRVTGLLILKNGEIVAERYRYGRTEDARFLSFSMAKSVTSMLVGIALERGLIASLDDAAQTYAKELEGSPYGQTTLRQLLRMSSGLVFTERYDGQDDVARMVRAMQVEPPSVIDVLRSVTQRHAPAGDKFVYASAESMVLGRVLAAATGRTLAELTSEWLWTPIGAEREAYWRIGLDGHEGASGYFHASLRDWGRLGLMLARDGRVGERQVLPNDYLLEATDPAKQPPAFRPRRATPNLGYGHQFWLFPMKARSFGMQGVYGQALFVQPSSGIVMVQTAVYAMASGRQDPAPFQERDAFWRGVLLSLGGSTD